jgi:hypothetical protein
MATLDSVIENINSFNNTGQLSEALEGVSNSLETGTGVTALGEISELIKTQGNMSVKELKRSREDLVSLKDKVLASDRIAEKDRSNILTLIENQESVINQNTTLSKRAAEFVQENIKEKIPDIAGVAAGVLSESPAAALGVKFIGDKIQENRERKRKEKEERLARLQRISDEEDRHNRELEVLRGQITNEETLSKVNMTQQEAADIAKQNGLDYQDYINELKNQLIEESLLAKQKQDVIESQNRETSDLKEKFGLDRNESDTSSESPISPGVQNTPTEPLNSLSDGDSSGEPYLEEIRDLLKFMSNPDTVTPFDIENSREQKRFNEKTAGIDKSSLEQLEEQTKLLEKISKINAENGAAAGGGDGILGGLGGAAGGLLGGGLGAGRKGGRLGKIFSKVKGSRLGRIVGKAGKLGRIAKVGGIAALGATAASALSPKIGKLASSAGSTLVGGAKRIAGSVGEMAGNATASLKKSIGTVGSSAADVIKSTPKPTALTSVADSLTKTGPDMIDGKVAAPKVTAGPPKVSSPPKLPKAAGVLDSAKGALKNVTAPVVKLKGNATKSIAGALDKTIAKKILATKGAKLLAKAIPGIGAAAGGLFALSSLFKGDFVGAAAEAGGIFLPSVAGAPLDAGIMARETYNQMFGNADNPFPLEGDMIKQPDVAKGRMTQLKDMALDVIGLGQEELDKQGKIQALKQEVSEAEDRISRSTGGENVYYGRDSKGIEKDEASIAAKKAEISSLTSSSVTAGGNGSTPPDLSGGSAISQMSSSKPNTSAEMNTMLKDEAMSRNTPVSTGGTANVVNAPQQNINASRTTVVQQPHVRNPDPSIGFAQRGLQGAV